MAQFPKDGQEFGDKFFSSVQIIAADVGSYCRILAENLDGRNENE